MPQPKVNFYLLPTFFFVLFSTAALGQVQDSLKGDGLTFRDLTRVNRPLSYLTFGEGLGNLEPLLFEAQIASSFYVTGKRSQWTLQFSPHIVLRMKRTKSLPVENPSYIAPIYFHHRLGFWDKIFQSKFIYSRAYATVGLAHHSNGQEGPFFKNDGSINLENGSFSTNYASFALTLYQGISREGLSGFSLLELYYERHLPWLSLENGPFPRHLEDIYGLNRLKVKYSNLDLSKKGQQLPSKFLASSRIISQAGWIFGPIGQAEKSDIKERLLFSLRYMYYPEWLRDIALFTEFYRGQDYYNIRFERNLSVFKVGLISDPLNLGAATELFKRKDKAPGN
ncbi:hypothetical protein ACFSRY_18910 [Pontibacter locisalis]|uniref:Phosphatidylcholine 1-acylhydrolase n=1 Tax=Pontibacter locisalis TaxID=1719035 RepID=A0ABW5ITD2_9BACT